MNDDNVIQRLETDLRKLFNIKVAGNIVSHQNKESIILKVDAPPYVCIVKDFEYEQVRNAFLNETEWQEMLQKLHDIVLQRSFSLILDDLRRICETARFYEINYPLCG